MKVAPVFEIKVALMGYVSVGKTTVLNALFRDKYGEVSMRRTTAGVDNFRLSVSQSKESNEQDDDSSNKKRTRWSMIVDSPRSAKVTLKEITADNVTFRESNQVHEKTFDIELPEELCKMRQDTKLVIVDIPGINEAGASSKYKDYVSNKWHTFDCVVVVMDGRHGVNTEEQINLLKLVEDLRRKIKNVPVIILCNKIDEPEDEEQQMLVHETREAVEKIFGPKKAPSSRRTAAASAADYDFIPISAVRGFIYRTASRMSFEDFQRFDKDLVERLGREVYGTSWRRLCAKKKVEKAHSVVTDPEQCREGLEISNFDKFLKVLSSTIGGEATQLALINKQIDVAAARLSPDNCLADEIRRVSERCRGLGKSTDHLAPLFWKVFKDCEKQAFDNFKEPSQVASLSAAMAQLTAYHGLVKEAGWKGEEKVIKDRMKKLIRRQLGVLFEKVTEQVSVDGKITASTGAWSGTSPGVLFETVTEQVSVDGKITASTGAWSGTSPAAWEIIFRSILMVTSERACYEHFGQEIVWVENFLRLTRENLGNAAFALPAGSSSALTSLPQASCPSCQRKGNMHRRYGVICCNYCNKYFNTKSNKGNCGYCKYSNNYVYPCYNTPGYCNSCGYATVNFSEGFPEHLKIKFVDGRLEPVDGKAYKRNVGIQIPADGPSDPGHYGHLLWHFYRFMHSVEKN